MYNPINGWTKEKILDVIRARPSEKKSINDSDVCVYLTSAGNKCAVGLFIPDGHPGQILNGSVRTLLEEYPDLNIRMPLQIEALQDLQLKHDGEIDSNNVKDTLINWVNKHVEDKQ